MSDRWIALAATAVVGATAVAAVAHAGPRRERFGLAANGSGVTATATLSGGSLSVAVAGLPANARVEAAVARLACAQRGYAHRDAGGAVADESGHAAWTAPGVVRASARDGWHVLALGVAGRTVACAAIPAARSAATPSRPRHWGIWTFARRFMD